MQIIRFQKTGCVDAYFNPEYITYIDTYTYKDHKTDEICEGSDIHFVGQDMLRVPIDRETLIKNIANKTNFILES